MVAYWSVYSDFSPTLYKKWLCFDLDGIINNKFTQEGQQIVKMILRRGTVENVHSFLHA
jgi:hypothetical protein